MVVAARACSDRGPLESGHRHRAAWPGLGGRTIYRRARAHHHWRKAQSARTTGITRVQPEEAEHRNESIICLRATSFSFGFLRALGDLDPLDTSTEADFARDMQVHHNQGVELAFLDRDRTDDSEVRLLAFDIATTQGQQSGQLYGWLAERGLAQASSEPSMT